MVREARTASKKAPKITDSDSDSTEAEATPRAKPSNARLKRRVSQFQPQDDDFEEHENTRIPLKPVNDEIAEKRSLKRRKSSRMSLAFDSLSQPQDVAESSQDPSNTATSPKAARRATLARANQIKSVAVPAPLLPVSLEIMTSNFEEWMKMATDNKINANNSWNFALIDYFHDMSLLRNDGDNSINFQKASRTLDGCVKIWTSRVDSVGTDTGKLLSNLAADGRAIDDSAEGDEGGEGGPDGLKKKKVHRQEATLAKNAAQLQTKKLDLEFTIDPLFKKTSSDFDEGGAQGLLMNHLAVDGGLRVIFDAMDTPGGAEEVEHEEETAVLVSLADLRAKLDLPSIQDRSLLSQRLSNFRFSSNVTSIGDQTLMDASYRRQDRDDDLDSADEEAFQDAPVDNMDITEDSGAAGQAQEPEDFFSGDQAVDDFGGFGAGDDYGDGDGEPSGEGHAEDPSGEHRPGAPAPFDPRRPPDQRELVMAMAEDGGASMLDYFDSSIVKNWAGPEHWKLRKVIRRPDKADQPAAPKPRKEKQAFSIDFSKRSTADYEKKLFEPPAKGSLTLPAKQCAYIGGKRKKGVVEKREEKLLPDDMHFSNKQLLSLFLKPKFVVNFRGHRAWLRPDNSDEIDEHFWAKAAADAALPPEDDMNTGEDTGNLPFNTQFFHEEDDYGGGGFDDAFGDGGGGGDLPLVDENDADLLAATQGQVRRVRPEFVNYAKKVKRVDVRQLKENIWKGLDIIVKEEEDTSSRPPTDPNDAKQFTSVISGLRRTYPKDKMEEISTSFCFICLLHLANERGLKIEGSDEPLASANRSSAADMMKEDDPDYAEGVVNDSKHVGDIWGLKIYRDPDAIPSA